MGCTAAAHPVLLRQVVISHRGEIG